MQRRSRGGVPRKAGCQQLPGCNKQRELGGFGVLRFPGLGLKSFVQGFGVPECGIELWLKVFVVVCSCCLTCMIQLDIAETTSSQIRVLFFPGLSTPNKLYSKLVKTG